MNISKFLVAENTMLSDDVFIVHTRKPRFIAKVMEFENRDEIDVYKKVFDSESLEKAISYSEKEHNSTHYLFVPYEYLDDLSDETQREDISKVLKRMADWYRAYLIHCFSS